MALRSDLIQVPDHRTKESRPSGAISAGRLLHVSPCRRRTPTPRAAVTGDRQTKDRAPDENRRRPPTTEDGPRGCTTTDDKKGLPAERGPEEAKTLHDSWRRPGKKLQPATLLLMQRIHAVLGANAVVERQERPIRSASGGQRGKQRSCFGTCAARE